MYIIGTHLKNIYYNEANGFTVGLLKIIASDEDFFISEVIWTGHSFLLTENLNYKLFGEVVFHPKYGKQFKVEKIEKVLINDQEKIIKYLASDFFPGIGHKTALKVVEILGEDALEKIKKDYQVLETVPISRKNRETIYNNLVKYDAENENIEKLITLGFSMIEAVKIKKLYENKTMEVLENNLYQVFYDFPEFSFAKIDQIALANTEAELSQNRMVAYLFFLFKKKLFNEGHIFLEKAELLSHLEKNKFFLDASNLENYLALLAEKELIVLENEKIYLFEFAEAEKYIVDYLKNLKSDFLIDCQDYLSLLNNDFTYNDDQLETLVKVFQNKVTLITGGPGVGKSTLIKGIVAMEKVLRGYKKVDMINNIALLAPTGRASKRLRELTNLPAKTIHRFLKWQGEDNQFLVNEDNKAREKLIIVDEASMIDTLLFVNLLKGLSNDVRLVLVGDYNQLPPVAAGQVFKDLIKSKCFTTGYLTEIYRQKKDTFIPLLAEYVKNGIVNEEIFLDHDDYQFIECEANQVNEILLKTSEQFIKDDIFAWQVIAPLYRGVNGIDNLNKLLQNKYNQNEKFAETVFKEADKVIQLVNQPEDDIFNGDLGIVNKINVKEKTASGKLEIIVNFDEKKVVFSGAKVHHLKPAYVISIHKSQGGEFPFVIMPIVGNYGGMLYRLLLYTGITRAKQKLIIIGEKEMFKKAILNNAEINRNSFLEERLRNEIIS